MNAHICSVDQVRAALAPMSLKQLEALAAASGVPFATIYKIRRGETANPGIETVRQFFTHIDGVMDSSTAPGPAAAQEAA